MRSVFTLLVAAGIMVMLEATFFAIRSLRRRKAHDVEQRLRAIATGEVATGLLRRQRMAASPELEKFLRRLPLATEIEKLLEAADVEYTVARLLSASAGLAAAVLVLCIAFSLAALPILVLTALAVALPPAYVRIVGQQRSRKLSEQLPEALDMMARSVKAGHAVPTAFHMVATEMPSPINVEFARAFEEQRLGRSLGEAIIHMTRRMTANRDLKIFAVSVIIQRETGGNFAEILQGIADTIRARYRFEGKLRAITAEGRASGMMLSVMPLAFVVLLQIFSPGYLTPLVEEPTGRLIILYAVALWVFGMLWLRRLTRVGL